MKTMIMITRRFFSMLFVTSLLIACSADDGEDGAIGPQGVQGEQGPQGPQGEPGEIGPQGEQGETGSANVIYSGWIDSEFDNNIIATSTSFSIEAPEMDDDIISQGVIKVFGRTTPEPITNDTDVYALPIVFGAAVQQTYLFRAEAAGELVISVASTQQGQSVGVPRFGEFRYVLIPGEVPSSGKSSPVDYTKMTYEEIVAYFNIPE